jgi:hypothetical protein
MALHDALIKNSGTTSSIIPLCEGHEVAKDGTSATFRLRDGVLTTTVSWSLRDVD